MASFLDEYYSRYNENISRYAKCHLMSRRIVMIDHSGNLMDPATASVPTVCPDPCPSGISRMLEVTEVWG